MTETHRGIIVWGAFLAFFIALDTSAHEGWLPIPTLSGLVWDAIKWWPLVAYLVALVIYALLGHFDAHWSVRWLIGSGLFAAAVILAHVATR